MPHVTVEYSANLKSHIHIETLVRVVHDALVHTGEFPSEVLRIRAVPYDQFLVGGRADGNAFLAIVCRIAPGRPSELRHRIGQAVFDAARAQLEPAFQHLPISFTLEISEIDQTAAFRRTTIVGQ